MEAAAFPDHWNGLLKTPVLAGNTTCKAATLPHKMQSFLQISKVYVVFFNYITTMHSFKTRETKAEEVSLSYPIIHSLYSHFPFPQF